MTREEYLAKRRAYYQKNKHKWKEYAETHKEQRRKYYREWRKKNRMRVNESAKRWRDDHREILRKRSKEYHASERGRQRYREYYESHREDFFARAKKSRKNHKDELRANSIVNHNIERGKLKRQPCEVCGAEKADAHHDDYNKPLDVRWLCRRCHADWHSKHEPIRATNEKQCALCGKIFVFTHRAQKFCSDTCRKKWNKAKAHQYYLENIEKWKKNSVFATGVSVKE